MKGIIQWIVCLILAIIVALLLKHFVFTPTLVNQFSMRPTLENVDRLKLDRLSITLNKEKKRGTGRRENGMKTITTVKAWKKFCYV